MQSCLHACVYICTLHHYCKPYKFRVTSSATPSGAAYDHHIMLLHTLIGIRWLYKKELRGLHTTDGTHPSTMSRCPSQPDLPMLAHCNRFETTAALKTQDVLA